MIESLSPMLAVQDVAGTANYFRDCLGFKISFIAESDSLATYAAVHRDGFEIHFLEDPHRDANEVRSGINVVVRDVDEFFEEIKNANAFASGFPRHLDAIREHPPEDKEYGMRDLIFVDPNGYILVFGQPL